MKKLLLFALALIAPQVALAQAVRLAQYGVAVTENFYLLDAAGLLDVNESDSGTETTVMKDNGTPTTASADFVDRGSAYSIALTGTELTAARLEVAVQGEILNSFFIETYGHPAAAHPQMGAGAGSWFYGQATAGSDTSLTLAAGSPAGDDDLIGMTLCVFAGTGSPECENIAQYNGTTKAAVIGTTWSGTDPTSGTYYYVYPTKIGYAAIGANARFEADIKQCNGDPTCAAPLEAFFEANPFAQTGDSFARIGVNGAGLTGVTATVNCAQLTLSGLVAYCGTADSGTVASFVDAALTQSDANYWAKSMRVTFLSGTLIGQSACVLTFVPGTDTVNFAPSVTQAVGTHTYAFVPDSACKPF